MRTHGMSGLLLVLLVLAGSGCQTPLKPESEPAQGSASATPSPKVSPPPDAASSPSATPSRKPLQPPPSLNVPEITLPPKQTGEILGGDISWPQCPQGMGIAQKQSLGSPMPVDAVRYVILGLTNGPGFYPNPCLASQTEWVRSRGLMAAAYSVISTPEPRHLAAYKDKGPYDPSTELGALGNVGYQQALFNLTTMRAAGLQSPIIWLDVEPVPEFDWPSDTIANAAVVKGAARGYTEAGFTIGVYSTQALWARVVGGLRLGVPEWRAAGETSRAEASRRCGPDRSFQGGPAVLGQWVEAGRDMNITCPGTSANLGRWFHQY